MLPASKSASQQVSDGNLRILIAGGGTGGHVIPALAIARELKTRYDAEVLFVGTARGMENRLVPQAGFGLMRVKVGALKNVSLITRVRTLFDLPRGGGRGRIRFRPGHGGGHPDACSDAGF